MLNPNPFATIGLDAVLTERPGETGMTIEGATVDGAECDPFAVDGSTAACIITALEDGRTVEVVLSGDGASALGIVGRPMA